MNRQINLFYIKTLLAKYIYEVGLIFRGFVILSHDFKELPMQKVQTDEKKDLRGAFISAISTFAETAFNNNTLEYLESGEILFIFKLTKVKSKEGRSPEPLIMYGLTEKKKKNNDKFVKKFLIKVEPILETFTSKYTNKDFTNLTIFEPFEAELSEHFFH